MYNKRQILTINIGNPSLERVKRQIAWIKSQVADVFLLTETKNSVGCNYLEKHFQELDGWHVNFPKSQENTLGVILLSRFPVTEVNYLFDKDSLYFSRTVEAKILLPDNVVSLLGMYVPSRDRSPEKVERKKRFLQEIQNHLLRKKEPYDVVLGDLNILEPDHNPHYSTFYSWEYDFYQFLIDNDYVDAFRSKYPTENQYSWVGRTGQGYRYDHVFVRDGFPFEDCRYDHGTRIGEEKFTDHSGVVLKMGGK